MKNRIEFQAQPEKLQKLKNPSVYPLVDDPCRIKKIGGGKSRIIFKPVLILSAG